jgi:hypothetical protein
VCLQPYSAYLYMPWRPACRICINVQYLCNQAEPRLVRGLVGVKAWTVQCGHQHSGGMDLRLTSTACSNQLLYMLGVLMRCWVARVTTASDDLRGNGCSGDR